MNDAREPLANGHLFGAYRIDGVLGPGGFGLTYKGHDTRLHRTVAIKEYLPSDLVSRQDDVLTFPTPEAELEFHEGRRRFLNEARVLAKLRHPNIVAVHDFVDEEGASGIVMEFVEGQPLNTILAKRSLSASEGEKILFGLMDGLESLHNLDILHRDIKPANILIRPNGQPVLIDFGAARQKGQAGRGAATRERFSVMLTEGYAPYEQYEDDAALQGPWSDIYALAATLYRGLSGVRERDMDTGRSRGSAVARGHEDGMRPLTEAAKGVAEAGFLEAIDRGFAPLPEARPQSIAQWRRLFPNAERPPLAPTPTTARIAADPVPEDQPTLAYRPAEPEAAPTIRRPSAPPPPVAAPAQPARKARKKAGATAPIIVALAVLAAGAGGVVAFKDRLPFEREVIAAGPVWSHVIGGSEPADPIAVSAGEGGVYVGGVRKMEGGLAPWLGYFDDSGELVWQKRINLEGQGEVLDLAEAGDGGLLIGGERSTGTGSEGWIVKLDTEGEKLWRRSVGAGRVFAVVQNKQRIFAVVSRKTEAEPAAPPQLAIFDTAGKRLDTVRLPDLARVDINAAVRSPDGGVYLSGVQSLAGGAKGWAGRFDSAGKLVWQKTIGPDLAPADCYAATPTQPAVENGARLYRSATFGEDLIVAGSVCYDSTRPTQALVARLNASGDIVWSKTYGDRAPMAGRALVSSKESSGRVIYLLSLSSREERTRSDSLLTKLDADGKVLTTTWSASAQDENPMDLAMTPAGPVVIARLSSAAASARIWVGRFDRDGAAPPELGDVTIEPPMGTISAGRD